MKKLRPKRKLWLDRHSRQRAYKRDKHILAASAYSSNRIFRQSEKIRDRLDYLSKKRKYTLIVAPEIFSLYKNPDGVLLFYENVTTNVMLGNPVFFDMSRIQTLTIDAIMYFLAVLRDLKESHVISAFRGNFPLNKECKELLKKSGFLRDVDSNVRVNWDSDADNIKIIKGSISNPEVAKNICKFAIQKLPSNRLYTKELYDVIMELMTNTRHWAYKEKGEHVRNWYLFAKYIEKDKCVRFTFLDTGQGIPQTIKKKNIESLADAVGLSSHSKYIESALKGEFRSRTGEKHRGEGLPRICSYEQEGYIKDLTVISEKGYYSISRNDDIDRKLKGSLFYWEVHRSI